MTRPKKTKREAKQPEVAGETDHEQTLQVLKESGLLVQLGPEWDAMLSGKPILSHEEILKMMAGQRPLSEDTIEMRGEL
jgi:hypothetical protein